MGSHAPELGRSGAAGTGVSDSSRVVEYYPEVGLCLLVQHAAAQFIDNLPHLAERREYKGAIQEVKVEIPFTGLGVRAGFQARR